MLENAIDRLNAALEGAKVTPGQVALLYSMSPTERANALAALQADLKRDLNDAVDLFASDLG